MQVGQLAGQHPAPQPQPTLQGVPPPPPPQYKHPHFGSSAPTSSSMASTTHLGGLSICSVDAPRQLMAVSGQRRVRIGVDSGAGVTVWPSGLCDDYPTIATPESRAGVQYMPAGAGSKGITDEGKRTYKLKDGDGQDLEMNVHVANVRKPLLSVAEVNDRGLDVLFRTGAAAVIRNPQTGQEVELKRVNNVFEIEADVLPFGESSGGRGQAPP